MHRRHFPSFDAGAAMAVQAAAEAAAMEALRVERLHLPAVPAPSHRLDQQQTATQVRPRHGACCLPLQSETPAGSARSPFACACALARPARPLACRGS
jgi:hypothetical protein